MLHGTESITCAYRFVKCRFGIAASSVCGTTARPGELGASPPKQRCRFRNWSLIRPWGCKSALRKWHMRGAWVGEMQALVGCGERCGPLVTVYRSCAIAAYLEVNPFFYRKSVVSAFKAVVG